MFLFSHLLSDEHNCLPISQFGYVATCLKEGKREQGKYSKLDIQIELHFLLYDNNDLKGIFKGITS